MSNEAEESVLVAGNSEAGEATWNSGLTDYDELVTAKGWSCLLYTSPSPRD